MVPFPVVDPLATIPLVMGDTLPARPALVAFVIFAATPVFVIPVLLAIVPVPILA